jgi:hypothetical protein
VLYLIPDCCMSEDECTKRQASLTALGEAVCQHESVCKSVLSMDDVCCSCLPVKAAWQFVFCGRYFSPLGWIPTRKQ